MFSIRKSFISFNRCTSNARNAFTLPALPYPSNALEPIICAEIMELHHQKHHNAYVTNLNNFEAQLKDALSKNDISKAISLQPAIKFNGGGHINHTIFWNNLSPSGGNPDSALLKAIGDSFGNLDGMKNQLMALANGIQGSGWGWLGYNKSTCRLQLATCANQDPLEATTGLVPLFGIDVWEHAYYLQYKNARAEYTKALFDIINWKDVSERFAKAK